MKKIGWLAPLEEAIITGIKALMSLARSRRLFLTGLAIGLWLFVLSIPILSGWAQSPSVDLKKAIQDKRIEAIQKIVDDLARQNDDKSYNILISEIKALGEEFDYQTYAILLTGVGQFTSPEVIGKITEFILSNKANNLGKDMLAVGLKNSRTCAIIPALGAVLKKCPFELQTEAIHQLSGYRAKESIEALINFLETVKPDDKDKKDIVKKVIDALRTITNIDRGNYHESWVQWWNENKNKPLEQLIKPRESGGFTGTAADYREMKEIRTIPSMKIIVVRNDRCDDHGGVGAGNFDHIERILERFDMEFTLMGKSQIEDPKFNWDDKWAILFNCNLTSDHCRCPTCVPGKDKSSPRLHPCTGCNKHDVHNTRLNDETIKKIARFVETGGYLFTEDWNIEEILERAFRGYVGHSKFLPGQTVPILPAPGNAMHPYLKYVFEPIPEEDDTAETDKKSGGSTRSVKTSGGIRLDASWKIDDDSPDIKVLNKQAVTILMVSPKLKKGANEGAVAITFGYTGKTGIVSTGTKPGTQSYQPGGRVLHVMSHFGKQHSQIDEFALQNLLLNFLEELIQRRTAK